MIDNQKNNNAENMQQNEASSLAGKESLTYNTSCEPLKMPEYGRLVLQMVEYALTIEDRNARLAYAKKIVRVMAGLNPQMKHVPDYQHKLWDHLAYLANYELDVDYPFEIHRFREDEQPHRLTYPGTKIKLRHYGHLVENLLEQLELKAHTPERNQLIVLVAERMRRNLMDWKGDAPDDERIARDIMHYTNNVISVNDVLDCLSQVSRGKRGRRN